MVLRKLDPNVEKMKLDSYATHTKKQLKQI